MGEREYTKTFRSTVNRLRNRGMYVLVRCLETIFLIIIFFFQKAVYDQEKIHAIVDSAPVLHKFLSYLQMLRMTLSRQSCQC